MASPISFLLILAIILQSEADKTPIHKSDKTPIHKSDQTPIHKSDKTPIHKSDKTPIHKSDKTPIHKSDKTPIHKSDEETIHISDEIPIHISGKTPIHKWDEVPIPKSIKHKFKCPKDKPKVKYCLMNPCTVGQSSFCSLYPTATCYPYLCGGCYSKWFNSRKREVFCSRR
ncbi:uncharacterized protein LOC118766410 [Octopus sinensis]|uniref:Uncharacterized protein LOC118766410 n=1 Tax=Octopus sinensis TaxID=2607531 RepID=A0A7E6FD79_9MOLL|nr:uncharacterized protein LOC118766410 [Octopus sinensis]